ncbi:SIS domain-containing protein [bacterium]|nr:SIS domain-containing protein [bacterium]
MEKKPYFLYERYPALKECSEAIEAAAQTLDETYKKGGTIYCCGNGGSAADCEHIVGELMKGFLKKRPLSGAEKEELSSLGAEGEYLAAELQKGVPAVSLVNSVGLGTAFANDVAPELIFAQQIYSLGKKGDALIAISTSGNSKNVIYAILAAKAKGVKVVGLTGASGGRMAALCDHAILAPSDSTPEIQEYHLPIYHYLCQKVEKENFPE